MRVSWSLRRLLRLPSRIALLLGLGALAAAGARADSGLGQAGAGIAPLSLGDGVGLGDVLIRTEGGRIYLSEGGGEFQELRLHDLPESRLLTQLLERDGAAQGSTGIRLSPMLLAGSGGNSFNWAPGGKTDQPDKGSAARQNSRDKAGAPAATKPPEQTGLPGKSDKPVAAGRG
jgi:hypothetical protein